MITIKNKDTGYEYTIVPSQYKWSLMSVNAAESGRTYTGKMYTNRVTQKRKIELTLNGVEWSEASNILTAVNSEYCEVTFPDMLTGKMRTSECYAGDRSGDAYVWFTGKKVLSNLSFNLIER